MLAPPRNRLRHHRKYNEKPDPGGPIIGGPVFLIDNDT